MIRIVLILFFAWITTVQAEIVKIEKRGIADDIIKCEWENQEGVPCETIRVTVSNTNKISEKISNKTINDNIFSVAGGGETVAAINKFNKLN